MCPLVQDDINAGGTGTSCCADAPLECTRLRPSPSAPCSLSHSTWQLSLCVSHPVSCVAGDSVSTGGVSGGEDRFGTGAPTDTMRRFVLYHYNGLEDPGRKPVCVTVNVSQIDDSSGSGASGVASPPSPHPVPAQRAPSLIWARSEDTPCLVCMTSFCRCYGDGHGGSGCYAHYRL